MVAHIVKKFSQQVLNLAFAHGAVGYALHSTSQLKKFFVLLVYHRVVYAIIITPFW